MNTSFECADKVTGLLTIVVEESDYKDDLARELKAIRKLAITPGFRPGMTPMSIIERKFGLQTKVDIVNRMVGEELTAYVREHGIKVMGEPLASIDQPPLAIEGNGPHTFMFDIAVAPEIDVDITEQDVFDYYDITVTDADVDSRIEGHASRFGRMLEAERYADGDSILGTISELDESGQPREGGIHVEDVRVMPRFFVDAGQAALFEGTGVGDSVTFNPGKAYSGRDFELATMLKMDRERVGEVTADFRYEIREITHFQHAEVDQELFDNVFGEGVVSSAEEFRAKVAEGIKAECMRESNTKFLDDVKKRLIAKAGEVKYADSILKRVLAKDHSEEELGKSYEESLRFMTWRTIAENLVLGCGLAVKEEDIREVAREVARAGLARYGITHIEDERLDEYANAYFSRKEDTDAFMYAAMDRKALEAVRIKCTVNVKPVTMEEFVDIVERESPSVE